MKESVLSNQPIKVFQYIAILTVHSGVCIFSTLHAIGIFVFSLYLQVTHHIDH